MGKKRNYVKCLREQLHGAAVRVFVADEQQVAEICVWISLDCESRTMTE